MFLNGASLVAAMPHTGRTHQIRVHTAYVKHPVGGDEKYGDFAFNREVQKAGLKRMFLHAWKMQLSHPLSGEMMHMEAPLPKSLDGFIRHLSSIEPQDYGQEL